MNPRSPDFPAEILCATAASWTVRRDRGLSAAESIEYELWLAANPRHATAMKLSSAAWSSLDGLPESVAIPVLAAARRHHSFWRQTIIASSLAAAAALAIGVFVWSRHAPAAPAIVFSAHSAPRTVTLTDGSFVQLNIDSQVVEQFTASERHVLLVQGEAHFSVTKNPARPFIVRAGELQVRAVGTAFNIKLQSSVVDVIVTEGRVQVASATDADHFAPSSALNVGGRAVLRSDLSVTTDLSQALVCSQLAPTEMVRALAWREPLLRLGGATLAELALEFERSTGRRLVFADPAIAELRFGGRFRAGDLEGFTQVLANTLDIEVEYAADGTITLRKRNPLSR